MINAVLSLKTHRVVMNQNQSMFDVWGTFVVIAEALVRNRHQLNVLSNDHAVSQPRQGQAQHQRVSNFRLDSGLKCTIEDNQMNRWTYLDKPIAEETVTSNHHSQFKLASSTQRLMSPTKVLRE